MSFARTSLSGFSFTGRGGTLWRSSKATDFRFLDIFIAGGGRRRGSVWRMGKNGKAGPIIHGDGSASTVCVVGKAGMTGSGASPFAGCGRPGVFRPCSVAHLIGPVLGRAGHPKLQQVIREVALHYHSLRTQLPISYPTPDSSRAFRLVRGRQPVR